MEILGIGFLKQILIFFMIGFMKILQLAQGMNKNSWNEEGQSKHDI